MGRITSRFFEDRRVVLMPLETTVREFDYRVFISILTARRDRTVYVGRDASLIDLLPGVRGGVYLGKNIFKAHQTDRNKEYSLLKKQGFRLLHHDEEGAVFFGDEDTWRTSLDSRVDPNVLEDDDMLLTWGDFQADYYQSCLEANRGPEIVTAGHPRFDLMKEPYVSYYDEERQKLLDRFGDFVLVNTSRPLGNYHYGVDRIFGEAFGYDPDDPSPLMRRFLYDRRALADFIEIVHEAAVAMPHRNFVIRPHPSENHKFYGHIFAGRKNVHVEHEGSVIPWMLASKIVFHGGSTTGVEAHLSGSKIINFKEKEDPRFDIYLSDLFGTRTYNIADTIELLRAFERGEEDLEAEDTTIPERATSLLENFKHSTFDRVAEIVDDALDHESSRSTRAPRGRSALLYEGPWYLKDRSKRLVRPLFPMRHALFKQYRSRFVEFDNETLQACFRKASRILDKEVEVTLISPRLFSVRAV